MIALISSSMLRIKENKDFIVSSQEHIYNTIYSEFSSFVIIYLCFYLTKPEK